MAKKHIDISDEQQRALADIQANPKLLFTPEYSKWRDFLRRESPNYVDSLYNNLPRDVQYDIYMNNREGFGALSDKVKNNYKANLGATQTRGAIEDAGKFIWNEVVPWVPVLGTAKDWGEFFQDPTLENLAWAGLGTVSDAGVVKGVRRIANGVRSKKLLNTIDEVADSRKDQFAANFDLGKDVSKNAQSYLADLQKRGVLSTKDVVDYSDRLANARNANEVSIIQDELRRKASNNIAKGVALTTAGTAGDVFLANEQRLQQQGEEPWLINISSQPWAKWNLIEDVPYIIRDGEPDPRDYAKGGRLMITKRNTYRPHYFGNGGGDFQEVMEEGNSTMYQQQLAKQGFGQQSQNSNSGIGWQAGLGAAAGIGGQIGVSEKNPNGLYDTLDPVHYLANGRHGAGDGVEKAGVSMFQAGASSGNPWIMLAGAGLKIAGGITNAGWGHKTDEEQLARVNQGIDAGNNFQSNVSSFDDLQNPMVLANAGNVYEGGWFNKKKWRKKNEELQANVAEAQANVYNQFNNNLSNLQQDQMNNMLANYAAFGGPLHTHGSDWTNGITYVDNGGSHESNPYGGVPMGIAQDGQPNLVEEGEVIYKLNGSPYVYSKRLKMSKELKDKYKFKGDTFADGALEAQKESEERPNDPISQRGLNAIMSDLANEQEKERQKRTERQARKQAKQATYAYGGHMYEGGGLIFYNGKFYRDNGKGSYMPEDGKGSFLTAQDLKMLGNAVQYYNGDDFEIEEDWRERMSNPYPRQQAASTYTDPLDTIPNITTNWNYTDYVNRMHQEAEAAQARRNYETAVATGAVKGTPLTDQMAGNPYYGTAPSPLQQNNGWRSFLLPSDSVTITTPSASTTTTTTNTTPSTSVPTSKSTSTGTKGAGTATSKGTTTTNSSVDYGYLLDWMGDEANFAAANAAATKNGARNFTSAADLYKTATTGKPGPAMRGLLSAYNDFQNANRGGINYNSYNEGSPKTEALSSIPITNSISLSPERYQDTESANRLNYFTYLYGDEAAKKLKKAGFNPDGTRKEEYTGTNTAVDSNKELKDYRTWMRYAPIFGTGLALALDPWINRPDYTNADLVAEAGKSAGNVDFNPIGDFLPYNPFDRLFYANQLAANQAATRRALLNTTGGNAATARGLLLAADNQGINQMGNLWRQAEEYNEANRQAIAEFNRGTNMFNSEGRLKADMANQGQANLRINAAIEAAKLRALEDDRVAETRSANFTNFLDNLGDLGRENLYYNMVNNNNALYYGQNKKGESIYKGEGSTNNPVTMPMPIQQYTKTGKNGGYLTIKKKKR